MENSGLELQHIVFGTLIVGLVFAATELKEQPGMTGHAMDVISPTSATLAAELVTPAIEGAGLQIIAEGQEAQLSCQSTLATLAVKMSCPRHRHARQNLRKRRRRRGQQLVHL